MTAVEILLTNFALFGLMAIAVLSLTRPLGNPWWKVWK